MQLDMLGDHDNNVMIAVQAAPIKHILWEANPQKLYNISKVSPF